MITPWRSPSVWALTAVVITGARAWSSREELALLTACTLALSACAALLLGALLTRAWTDGLLWALIVFAVLQLPWMVVQLIAGDPARGLSEGSRYVAALLAIAAPLVSWWMLALLMVGLVASQSFLAVFAALVGLALTHRRRFHALTTWAAVGYCVLTLIFLSFVRPWPSWAERRDAWVTLAWPHYVAAPVWGLGLGSWQTTIPWHQYALSAVGPGWFGHAHSSLVEWIYETGLIGLILLIGFVVSAWPAFRRSPVAPSLVAIAILALGFHVFHSLFLLPWLTVLVGIGLAGERTRA